METNYNVFLDMSNPEHYEHHELSRAEKKRDREKQRRKDLNGAYDRLSALLFKIDPKIREDADERSKIKTSGDGEDMLTFNRLELVNSAVDVLERIHRENEERKMVIIHLSRGLLAGSNSGGLPPPPPPETLPAPPAPRPPIAPPPFPNPHEIQVRIVNITFTYIENE